MAIKGLVLHELAKIIVRDYSICRKKENCENIEAIADLLLMERGFGYELLQSLIENSKKPSAKKYAEGISLDSLTRTITENN